MICFDLCPGNVSVLVSLDPFCDRNPDWLFARAQLTSIHDYTPAPLPI